MDCLRGGEDVCLLFQWDRMVAEIHIQICIIASTSYSRKPILEAYRPVMEAGFKAFSGGFYQDELTSGISKYRQLRGP